MIFCTNMKKRNCSVKVDSRSPTGPCFDDSCNEVFPNLFISDQYVLFHYMLMLHHGINITSKNSSCRWAAEDKDCLKTIGITHILNADERWGSGERNGSSRVDPIGKLCEDVGIKYLGFQLSDDDNTPICRYFHQAAEFIEDGLSSGGMYLILIGKFLSLSDG